MNEPECVESSGMFEESKDTGKDWTGRGLLLISVDQNPYYY